nr:glycosyltransferase family 4 protein [Curtobacterium sp. VKM Ac-2852]
MGVPRSRIHEGFNAVDVTSIREVVQSTRPVQHGDHRLRIIYVGQLIPRKNVGALIGALTALPNASLTIVGVGPLRAQLEQQVIATLSDPDQVTFVGYVPGQDVAKLMLQHDVLVLPSLSEVWGLVVNEALACGLHVVVSTRAGVTRSVEKHAGVVVSDPDTSSLLSALQSLPDPVVRILNPEILQQTPARFSDVFERAIMSEKEL